MKKLIAAYNSASKLKKWTTLSDTFANYILYYFGRCFQKSIILDTIIKFDKLSKLKIEHVELRTTPAHGV